MADDQEPILPPVIPYPPDAIRSLLGPDEWTSCLDLWIQSVELRLNLPDVQFSRVSPNNVGVPFLLSYLPVAPTLDKSPRNPKASHLFSICYSLTKRILLRHDGQKGSITYFELLSSGSIAFGQTTPWKKSISKIWQTQQKTARRAVDSAKSALSTSVESQEQIAWLQKITALTKVLPEVATVTVAGADYLDTLMEIFNASAEDIKKAVTENIFHSFKSLLENKHITILTDNIYHIKSESDRIRKSDPQATTILSSLLCTTSFLKHFVSNNEIATRKQSLVEQLSAYRRDMLHLHPLTPSQRRKRGKLRAKEADGMHVHKVSQVSQVHELFPNLGTAYILKALDLFADNVENVIAALLEPKSLPAELQDQDIADTREYFDTELTDLVPRSTPTLLPERRNVFDNDEFDRLQIKSGQLRRGKKDVKYDKSAIGDEHAKSKAAILSALASFDSDDDERDDTYDVADVGGAVDNTVDTDERPQSYNDANEAVLFKSWKENPELFARDSKTRSSNVRQQFKRETGMTDEQIEGWAIMLNRDKRTQERLQDKYSTVRAFSGQQRALDSTRWLASASTENSENESGPERSNDARRMGQAGIRGHRNFGGGRGGSTTGPTDDASTQQARKRKEQGRGRGGASHRRDARAKKIGRGMGPLPQG